MERIRNEPRRIRRFGALFALVFGLALGGAAVASAAGGADEPQEYVVVRHILYAGPDGELISEEAGRTTVSAQFVVNPHIWDVDSLPVPVQYNADGAPGGLDVTTAITQAIGTWNGAGSGFSFAWGGSSEAETRACLLSPNLPEADGINTIRFVALPGLTLGWTCTLYPKGNLTKLVEFDMELDAEGAWSSVLPVPGNMYDLPTTIVHELGHAAGLGHSCWEPGQPQVGPACTSALRNSLMYYKLLGGQNKRVLEQDDLDGIRLAYPPGATNTPTNTPTNAPTSTPTASPTAPPISNYKVRAPQLARD